MIPLAAIGAIAGTAFNAFNAFNSARAAKRAQRQAQKELDNAAASKRNYYSRELYKNYFDGADAKNAIRSLNENMDKQRAISEGMAAVTAYADMEERYAQAKANLLNQKAANHSNAMSNALGGMAHSALGLANTLMPTMGGNMSGGVPGGIPKVDAPDANLDFLKEIPAV